MKADRPPHPLRVALKTLRKTLLDADLSILAASLSYATVFSLIPMLVIFFAISQWVGDYQNIFLTFKSSLLSWMTIGLKEDTAQELETALQAINLKAIGWVGAVAFLFSATKIMYDYEKCLLKIWSIRRKNLFARHFPFYVSILIGIPMGFIALAAVLEWSDLYRLLASRVGIESFFFFFLFVVLKWTPPQRVSWRLAFVVSALTFSLIVLAQGLYQLALHHIFQYNHYYGPIAVIPIFLIWIYLIWVLVLFGLTLIRAWRGPLNGSDSVG